MMKNSSSYSGTLSQSGSAVFIILLGIVLFAALAAAVTQSIRLNESEGGGTSGGAEKLALNYSETQQYLEAVKVRTNTLLISDNISEANLDFINDTYQFGGGADNCWNANSNCADSSCRVFSPYAGDGILPVVLSIIADTPEQTDTTRSKNGHGQVRQLSMDGVGSSAPDLLFEIKGVTPAFCNYYNAKQGITTNYTSSTVMSDIGEDPNDSMVDNFGGCSSGASFNSTHVFGDNATDFSGKKSFCAPMDTDSYEHRLSIIHVLKAR